MSMTTFFQFTHTSLLPLPPTRAAQTPHTISPVSTTNISPTSTSTPAPPTPETSEDIVTRGLATALSMLHSPELMIALNPLVQHYSRISPTDPAQATQLIDLHRIAPEFNVTLSHPNHSCAAFTDSQNGEWVHYEILDKFNMMFGTVSKLLTYKACFRPLYPDGSVETNVVAAPYHHQHQQQQTPTNSNSTSTSKSKSIGLETISDPGSGVLLLAKWTLSLSPTNPTSLILTESVKVHCNVLFSWFVRSQLETAHGALHKEFGMRFIKAMIEGDPMRGRDFRGGKSWGEVVRGGSMRGVGGGVGTATVIGNGTGSASGRLRGERDFGRQGPGDKEMDVDMSVGRGGERQWPGSGGGNHERRVSGWNRERDDEREEVVSAVGGGDDISVHFGGGRGLERTRTNDSGVSSMR